MNSIIKGIRTSSNVLTYFSMAALAIMLFLGAADVIGRYFINKPVKGTEEISQVLHIVTEPSCLRGHCDRPAEPPEATRDKLSYFVDSPGSFFHYPLAGGQGCSGNLATGRAHE